MNTIFSAKGRLIGFGSLTLLLTASTSFAQQIDPALAKSWEYAQQALPGVSYDLIKQACAEGKLTIYHTTSHDAAESQMAAFKKRFPCITTQAFELTAGPLRQRYQSEARANRYIADIVQDTDAGELNKEAAEGLLVQYLIGSDKFYPNATKKAGYWYALHVNLVGIAWNTNLVNDEQAKILSEWKGIANSAWSGKGGAVDPTAGGTSLIPWYIWPKLYGEDFTKQIGAVKPRIFGGISPAGASLASGDIAVIFNASEIGLTPLWSSGAPIRWSLPSPGISAPTAQAIATHPPHPNAAKLYQEYSFGEEGYGAWQKFGGAVARTGYKDQRQVAAEPWYKYPTSLYEYDPADVSANSKKITDTVHELVGAFH